jgi:hypothetical protein
VLESLKKYASSYFRKNKNIKIKILKKKKTSPQIQPFGKDGISRARWTLFVLT